MSLCGMNRWRCSCCGDVILNPPTGPACTRCGKKANWQLIPPDKVIHTESYKQCPACKKRFPMNDTAKFCDCAPGNQLEVKREEVEENIKGMKV